MSEFGLHSAHLIRTASGVDPSPVEAALARLNPAIQDLVRPVLSAPVSDAERAASYAACARITDRLVDVLERIRHRAPDAAVLVVDYLTIVPPSGSPGCASLQLTDGDYFRALASRLQLATVDAALRAGAQLVRASTASRDHYLCSGEPWVFGLEFDDLLAGGAKAFHPNVLGMARVADLVVRQVLHP